MERGYATVRKVVFVSAVPSRSALVATQRCSKLSRSVAQQRLCKHGDYATVKLGAFSAVRLMVYKSDWNA
jgi:hypothetical protein